MTDNEPVLEPCLVRDLFSRLVRLAAAVIAGHEFISPDAEDNPKTTPRSILVQAEAQRERLRLWAIEIREVANALMAAAPAAPAAPPSTAPSAVVIEGPSSTEYEAWLETRPDLTARFETDSFKRTTGYEIWRNAWLRLRELITAPAPALPAIPQVDAAGFADHLPLVAIRTAPGEYEIRARDGRVLWRMEGAALADWVCASVSGYDAAMRGLRASDDYTAFLETEAAKASTGRCPNCHAMLRSLHCCACEGCDGCREREASQQ